MFQVLCWKDPVRFTDFKSTNHKTGPKTGMTIIETKILYEI